MKLSNTLLGLGVGLFAGSAAALSLGEAHGHVVLGRPIDLIFDIHTDPGMELDVACIHASAVAGDTRIDSSRLRITALPVLAGRAPSIRLRSSMGVVEPILTVRLAVGCSGVVARTYDFFAEVPKEIIPGAAPLVIAPLALPGADSAAPMYQAAPAPVPTTPRVQPAPPRTAARRAPPEALPPKQPKVPAPRKATAPPSAAVAQGSAVAPGAGAPQARLTVEPLGHWLPELPAGGLRPSTRLQELPLETPGEKRAQAAALWQRLQGAGEETLQTPATQALLQQQQADVAAARASRDQLQGALTQMEERVERLDRERFPATLVYGLGALLLLAVALLGWLGLRLRDQARRRSSDWRDVQALHVQDFAVESGGANASELPAFLQAQVPEKPAAPVAAVAVPPLSAPAVSASAPLATAAAMATAPAALSAPAVRVLNPEELFDLQQQAEFFVSVGEHDQAIEVMKKHIADNETASPLMYLELLRLYRSLIRTDDFKQLRAQFQQHFNAHVPEFAAFQSGGRTLLDYPDTLAEIEALWSDAAVLALLENCIFRHKNGLHSAALPFELPAYDDLLLLYAIASTTPASTRGAPPPRRRTTPHAAPAAAMAPLAAVPLAQEPLLPESLVPEPFLPEPPLPSLAAVADAGMDFGLQFDPLLDIDFAPGAAAGQNLQAAPELPVNSNLIEYDDFLLAETNAPASVASLAPPAAAPLSTFDLDLDLSDPDPFAAESLPPLTQNDLPALPATPAPAPGQSIGFGALSDRFEARFELDELDGFDTLDADAAERKR